MEPCLLVDEGLHALEAGWGRIEGLNEVFGHPHLLKATALRLRYCALSGLFAVAPVLQRIGIHEVFFCPTLRFECCLGRQVVGVRTGKDRKDISLLFGFVGKGIEMTGVDTFPSMLGQARSRARCSSSPGRSRR